MNTVSLGNNGCTKFLLIYVFQDTAPDTLTWLLFLVT